MAFLFLLVAANMARAKEDRQEADGPTFVFLDFEHPSPLGGSSPAKHWNRLVDRSTAGDSIEIGFRLSEAASVEVAIEDAFGRRLVTLAAGVACGTELVRLGWNGRDDLGWLVPDGLYRVFGSASNARGEISAREPVVRDQVAFSSLNLSWISAEDAKAFGTGSVPNLAVSAPTPAYTHGRIVSLDTWETVRTIEGLVFPGSSPLLWDDHDENGRYAWGYTYRPELTAFRPGTGDVLLGGDRRPLVLDAGARCGLVVDPGTSAVIIAKALGKATFRAWMVDDLGNTCEIWAISPIGEDRAAIRIHGARYGAVCFPGTVSINIEAVSPGARWRGHEAVRAVLSGVDACFRDGRIEGTWAGGGVPTVRDNGHTMSVDVPERGRFRVSLDRNPGSHEVLLECRNAKDDLLGEQRFDLWMPGSLAIEDCYLDPFFPFEVGTMEVVFAAQRDLPCVLRIEDPRGTEIRSIPLAASAGRNSAFWDGRDSQGVVVASGLHRIIVESRAGGQSLVSSSERRVAVSLRDPYPIFLRAGQAVRARQDYMVGWEESPEDPNLRVAVRRPPETVEVRSFTACEIKAVHPGKFASIVGRQDGEDGTRAVELGEPSYADPIGDVPCGLSSGLWTFLPRLDGFARFTTPDGCEKRFNCATLGTTPVTLRSARGDIEVSFSANAFGPRGTEELVIALLPLPPGRGDLLSSEFYGNGERPDRGELFNFEIHPKGELPRSPLTFRIRLDAALRRITGSGNLRLLRLPDDGRGEGIVIASEVRDGVLSAVYESGPPEVTEKATPWSGHFAVRFQNTARRNVRVTAQAGVDTAVLFIDTWDPWVGNFFDVERVEEGSGEVQKGNYFERRHVETHLRPDSRYRYLVTARYAGVSDVAQVATAEVVVSTSNEIFVMDCRPAPGGILIDTLEITLNANINDGGLSRRVVRVTRGDAPVEGRLEFEPDSKVIRFRPDRPWEDGETYEVHVANLRNGEIPYQSRMTVPFHAQFRGAVRAKPLVEIRIPDGGARPRRFVNPDIRISGRGIVKRDITLDGQPHLAGVGVYEAGPHRIRAVAENEAGLVESAEVEFTIGETPEVAAAPDARSSSPAGGLRIVVKGVRTGGVYGEPVQPVILYQDDLKTARSASLDGRPYDGGMVTADGDHVLHIETRDAAGSCASSEVRFRVDTRPIEVDISPIVDGAVYRDAVVIDPKVRPVDRECSLEILLDHRPVGPGTRVDAQGTHRLEVNASSLLRYAGALAYFTIDRNKPTIAPEQVVWEQEVPEFTNDITRLPRPRFASGKAAAWSFDLRSDGASVTPDRLHLLEGSVEILMSAIDSAGNTVSVSCRTFVDRQPPEITVRGVSEGAYYDHAVTPEIEVTDAHIFNVSSSLDKEDYESGRPVSAAGEHVLHVTAVDRAGNPAMFGVRFSIADEGPGVFIRGVESGRIYTADVSPEIVVTGDATIVSVSDGKGSFRRTLDGDSAGGNVCFTVRLPREDAFERRTRYDEDGTISITASVTDRLSRSATAAVEFVVDVRPLVFFYAWRHDGWCVRRETVGEHLRTCLTTNKILTRFETEMFGPAGPSRDLDAVLGETDGVYALRARVFDRAWREGTCEARYGVDRTPPRIDWFGLSDRDLVPPGFEPEIEVWDRTTCTVEFMRPYLAFPDSSLLSTGVIARDQAQNEITEYRSFEVTTSAALISVRGLTSRRVYGEDVSASIEVFPETASPVSQRLDGVEIAGHAIRVSDTGEHTLEVRARDVKTGKEFARTLTFAIDRAPPAIKITGVEEGRRHPSPAVPVIEVEDAHPFRTIALLDHTPYESRLPVWAAGSHRLEVIATDRAGHVSTAEVRFAVEAR